MPDDMEKLIDAARAYHRAGVRKIGEKLKAEGRRKMLERLKVENPDAAKRVAFYWRADLDSESDDAD
jgi:hypothetical protein